MAKDTKIGQDLIAAQLCTSVVVDEEKGTISCKMQMAPELDEVEVTDDSIHTEWNGGITYKAKLSDIRKKYGDKYLKESFSTAIALCSKLWQVEQVLNRHFRKQGHIE